MRFAFTAIDGAADAEYERTRTKTAQQRRSPCTDRRAAAARVRSWTPGRGRPRDIVKRHAGRSPTRRDTSNARRGRCARRPASQRASADRCASRAPRYDEDARIMHFKASTRVPRAHDGKARTPTRIDLDHSGRLCVALAQAQSRCAHPRPRKTQERERPRRTATSICTRGARDVHLRVRGDTIRKVRAPCCCKSRA